MNISPDNPVTNTIGSGLTEEGILEAINKSGYPLQTIIASKLISQFRLQEEWSYIDRESQELRTLDILASKELYDLEKDQPRVRPVLNFLIECKQSTLPFVFFLTSSKPWVPDFPFISGLFEDNITIKSDDTASTSIFPITHLLGLHEHDFISKAPAWSLSFSKCIRRGSNLELSGTDTFNGLIFPLIKAATHFKKSQTPPKTAWYFDCNLTLAVGVVDAPIIGVSVKEEGNELISLPWVRVLKHESEESPNRSDREKTYAIDIVHKDFFQEYVDKHVLPFAEEFSRLTLKHGDVLATGRGFVKGMEKNWHSDIERRLQKSPIFPTVHWTGIIVENLMKLFRSHKES